MTNDKFGNDKINVKLNADSLALTQYSSEASQLIKSFTKNIPIVVLILILIASMTTFDLIMDLGFTRILSDETIDAMIIAVSLFLIVFIFFTVRPLLRSQKVLNKWSNLFENNAIKTGILLTINDKSKEEILHALSEIIDQIANPLQNYLAKSDNKEFYNISVGNTIFDILIDKTTIKSIDSDSLKNTINDYGNILVKIVENDIDKQITENVLNSLQEYKKNGNKIGLSMIIGESISQESFNIINKIKDKNISENLILIEKPNNQDYDLKNLNTVLT